jgi:hypothetical protein
MKNILSRRTGRGFSGEVRTSAVPAGTRRGYQQSIQRLRENFADFQERHVQDWCQDRLDGPATWYHLSISEKQSL